MSRPDRRQTPAPTGARARASSTAAHAARRGERGYALAGLIALMTIIALATAAAAPDILKQNQREREREAIIRGEEMSDAIERYVRLMGRPPRSIEELLEGANPPGRTKRIQVVRAYATRDPLSSSGEWRVVQPQSRDIIDFQQALLVYTEGRPIPPSPEAWKNAARAQGITAAVGGLGRSDDEGEDDSSPSNVPFIGVASRSRRDSIVAYFGIENHHDWVFTPIYR